MKIEGFWDIFYAPIGWLMRVCYNLVPNYAVALLIFAFIIKLVLIPLGIKQQKNSIKQSKMYPYEKALAKKHQIAKIPKNPQLQSEAEKVRYQKYNAEKGEIIYSDSWGAGHERKHMPDDWAWTITHNLFYLNPR